MNLLHLKYAVEVAETNSITRAAENLYMAQPNLSRSIHELESDLGIEIFRRTSKGMFPTPKGEEFLNYARNILTQVDAVEKMYQENVQPEQSFSISVPRAHYIACAFTEFAKKLDSGKSSEVFYRETNPLQAIDNIVDSDYKLGIVRYPSSDDRYFKELLADKGLTVELICEFSHVVILSKEHPLANKESISLDDLKHYPEIAYADPFMPSLPLGTGQQEERSGKTDKRILVFERASQTEILSEIPEAFAWESPVPRRILNVWNLVQKDFDESAKKYRDMLIYKKDYALTTLDKMFIDQLMKFKRQISPSD